MKKINIKELITLLENNESIKALSEIICIDTLNEIKELFEKNEPIVYELNHENDPPYDCSGELISSDKLFKDYFFEIRKEYDNSDYREYSFPIYFLKRLYFSNNWTATFMSGCGKIYDNYFQELGAHIRDIIFTAYKDETNVIINDSYLIEGLEKNDLDFVNIDEEYSESMIDLEILIMEKIEEQLTLFFETVN